MWARRPSTGVRNRIVGMNSSMPAFREPTAVEKIVQPAEAAGEIVLKRGSTRQSFRLRAIPDSEKPPILEAHLDRFKTEVQRYFQRLRQDRRRKLSGRWQRTIRLLNCAHPECGTHQRW